MEFLGSFANLLLVMCGFTGIIFIHELGHFVAARWAGIRVLAFSIGFGPAVFSFRKGFGFRRGSSENDYMRLRSSNPAAAAQVSPTEYRWNWLPFGGYVKMLGQEDANPDAVSDEPDSYQRCVPWKRMVVISAGVIFNVILAALLFMIVFMVGMRNPAPRIGPVEPGSPAANCIATNAAALGVVVPGLQPGDDILSINGRIPNTFADLLPEVALSHKGDSIDLTVRREGLSQPLHFSIQPEPDRMSGVLDIGVGFPLSNRLYETKNKEQVQTLEKVLARGGIVGPHGGMTLTSAGGRAITRSEDLTAVIEASGGKPVEVTFKDEKGEIHCRVTPKPRLNESRVQFPDGRVVAVPHLLGLTPVLAVEDTSDRGKAQGLEPGDIFVRIGDTEYPSLADGIREIREHHGRTLHLVLLRRTGSEWTQVAIDASVDREGTIGFAPGDSRDQLTLLALPPQNAKPLRAGQPDEPLAASGVITIPGSRVVSVNGRAVSNFADLRVAIVEATATSTQGTTLALQVAPPATAAEKSPAPFTVQWTLNAEQIRSVRGLGWESAVPLGAIFQPDEVLIKAATPMEAISRGVGETRRWLLSVYVTFLRLFQGSVPVDQLHGPVGIAALGTSVASRGMIYLLFFLAMISVNLAVVNFLPLPIVDGGQFLFLVWEQIRGKPPSIWFQNHATLAGLVLIGSAFLLLTLHDIVGLFGR